ncbi:hypothetical protein WHI96_06655 [Pseudonocardia tropica]|uniref:Uncharacterized protein n=1 Tax=Pseudonocardia tropica TaxID=681289 RepID=A0ABV1JSR2_9PSEU
MAVPAVVVAVGAVVTTVRTGDSGARAAWTGQVAERPLGGSPGEPDGGLTARAP